MKLVAVTVHFTNPAQTTQLLAALLSNDSIDKVVVVIHGPYSTRPEHTNLIFLESENRGYGAGLNLAFRHIRENIPDTDLILALNPDAQISGTQIPQLVHAHLQAESDCTFPAVIEGTSAIHGYDFGRFGTVRRVVKNADFYPATCFLITPEAWHRANGFDEGYFHYFEDADFCLRLKKTGCKIHHAADVA
ncbi:MAG TPA: hypothetical protein VJ521_06030, partial [Acidobacteriota bacterium]|nr:hypothetical protein [Acidobacteriota bacterium]